MIVNDSRVIVNDSRTTRERLENIRREVKTTDFNTVGIGDETFVGENIDFHDGHGLHKLLNGDGTSVVTSGSDVRELAYVVGSPVGLVVNPRFSLLILTGISPVGLCRKKILHYSLNLRKMRTYRKESIPFVGYL